MKTILRLTLVLFVLSGLPACQRGAALPAAGGGLETPTFSGPFFPPTDLPGGTAAPAAPDSGVVTPTFAPVVVFDTPPADYPTLVHEIVGTPTMAAVLAMISPTPPEPPANNLPTQSAIFARVTLAPSPTPRPPPTPRPTAESSPTPGYRLVPVFSDALHTGWTIDQSGGVTIDLKNSEFVRTGSRSMCFTPTRDFATAFVTLGKDSTTPILYDDVLGVQFFLNPADKDIFSNDLGVAVVGSNQYTYYRGDDTSVELNDATFFSETRLYYLDINNSIPANTWVEITIWLDNLPYDPNYKYITGFYIKNDVDFRQTYCIDDASILMILK